MARLEKLRAKRAFEATLPPVDNVDMLPVRCVGGSCVTCLSQKVLKHNKGEQAQVVRMPGQHSNNISSMICERNRSAVQCGCPRQADGYSC